MTLAERAGHPTFWRVLGAGERPALAIHCALAHSGAWEGVMARLGDRITLTAFDLPGHGRSGDWDGQTDFARLSVQIAASFVERPLDLIGHSFGAVTALRLAVAAPEAVRTLTLIEPVLFAAVAGTDVAREQHERMEEYDRALAEGRSADAARAFTAQWGTGADWDAMGAESRQALVDRIDLIAASDPALFDDTGRILRANGLEGLDLPVLIIRGDRSPPIIAAVAEALAARMSDVGIATIPGAGHMAPLTHAAQVADLIALNLDRA